MGTRCSDGNKPAAQCNDSGVPVPRSPSLTTLPHQRNQIFTLERSTKDKDRSNSPTEGEFQASDVRLHEALPSPVGPGCDPHGSLQVQGHIHTAPLQHAAQDRKHGWVFQQFKSEPCARPPRQELLAPRWVTENLKATRPMLALHKHDRDLTIAAWNRHTCRLVSSLNSSHWSSCL